jgi:hypothetical protein
MISLSPQQCSGLISTDTTIQSWSMLAPGHSRLVGREAEHHQHRPGHLMLNPGHLMLNDVAFSTLSHYASDVLKFAQERLSLRED